jgi:hypothetical protein
VRRPGEAAYRDGTLADSRDDVCDVFRDARPCIAGGEQADSGRSRGGASVGGAVDQSGHLASLLLSARARQTRDQSVVVQDITIH